jgi:mannose-6-phosphate isomerase-like protein (cupin superfamily)
MEQINKENAEHYVWGDHCDGWHLVKTRELSVIQERVPPGGSETKHYHQQARQFFFILAGEAEMEMAGEVVDLEPQQALEVPPGVPHRLLNKGGVDLSFLVISVPPSHGDRVASD